MVESSRSRRLAKFGAGLGIGTAIGVSLVGAAQTAGAYEVPVTHWNIKGGCPDVGGNPIDDGNCGGLESANYLISQVVNSSNRPWHITLNEVCSPQYLQLVIYLQNFGYTGLFTYTNPDASPKCGQHGNALFTLGSLGGSGTWLFNSQAGESDQRKITCKSVSTYVGYRKVCVSHLTNGSTTVRDNQDVAAAERATNWAPSYPTIAGLDRNSNSRPNHWAASYKELDNTNNGFGRGTFQSFALTRGKVDWVWGSFNGNTGFGGSTVDCALGGMSSVAGRYLSDHCLLRGSFTNH